MNWKLLNSNPNSCSRPQLYPNYIAYPHFSNSVQPATPCPHPYSFCCLISVAECTMTRQKHKNFPCHFVSVYGKMHLKKYFQLIKVDFCCYLRFLSKVWFPIKSIVLLELISISELIFCPACAWWILLIFHV